MHGNAVALPVHRDFGQNDNTDTNTNNTTNNREIKFRAKYMNVIKLG